MNRAPRQLSLLSLLCLGAYSLLAACSSSDSPSNTSTAGAAGSAAGAPAAGSSAAGSPNGGQANAAGAAGQSQVGGAGGVSTGGTSAAGAAQGGAGGTVNHAGAGGTSGATNNAGATGDPGRPMGVVTACDGPGCPFGDCDQAACTSLYPEPLTADSMLCASNSTGQYCLVAGKAWAVVCSAGAASVSKCSFACDFDKVKLTATCP